MVPDKVIMSKAKSNKKKTDGCTKLPVNTYGAVACEHGEVRYQDLEKMNDKLWDRLHEHEATIERQSRSISILTDTLDEWKKFNKKNVKRINAWCSKQEKNEAKAWKAAVHWKRAYEGLFGMKRAAEALGIDTEKTELNGKEKKFKADHDFDVTTKQYESGKTKTVFNITKKKDKLN